MTINRDARILFSSRVQYNAFLRSLNTVATIQATRIATTEVGLAMEAVVLLEGAQTILGAKTFLSPIVAPSLIEDGTPLTSKYEPVFTKNTAFNKDFGSAAGTVTEGDDARLSDARTPLAHVHDAADITTGTIDLARLPAGSLERLVLVADETARFALTTASVQTGDTVQQIDTAVMYRVVDDTQLNLPAGYTEYTAGRASAVDWTGVENKPLVFPPDAHTHVVAEITDFDPADYAALADDETITGAWTHEANLTLANPNTADAVNIQHDPPDFIQKGSVWYGGAPVDSYLIHRFSHDPDQVGLDGTIANGRFEYQLLINNVDNPADPEQSFVKFFTDGYSGYGTGIRLVHTFSEGWGGQIRVNKDGKWRFENLSGELTDLSGKTFGTGHVSGYNPYWVRAPYSADIRTFFGGTIEMGAGRPDWEYADTPPRAGHRGNEKFNVYLPTTILADQDGSSEGHADKVMLTVQGHAAATANLTEWKLEGGAVLAAVDSAGNVTGSNLNVANWDAAFSWGDHALAGYLTSFTETDPVFGASAAAGIAGADITNWNTAFGWGDHAGLYQPLDADLTAIGALAGTTGLLRKTAANTWALDTSTYLTSFTETDPVFAASAAAGIAALDISNWDAAFAWGDHALAGYLTSFTETDPVFLASPAAGIAALDITNWNAAFAWGDHALAGYLTSFTETDPVFAASPAAGIAALDITNWNTAFGWGDHAGLYEPTFSKNTAFNKNFGSAAGTVCEGNDARLSDARTPTAHTHLVAEITDFDPADYLPLAGGTMTGDLNADAGARVSIAGSSGNNTSRELLQIFDDRTDRRAGIGTYRGAASTRIGLSFWGSFDAAPVERMRLNDSGDLQILGGDFFLGAGTMQTGSVPWARLTDVPATFTPEAHTHLVADITDFDPADYALDSVVVKLSGTQTIAGLKTFSTGIQANYVGAINTGGSNLRLWAPTGQDVRMEINSDVKLLAQVEGSGDNTTAAQVKHANGSYYDVGMNVMPITDLTTDLTLARSHVGGLIRKWDTAARNLNIPASTDTTIPIGARFEYAAWNPGTVTLVGGTGVQISWMTGAGVTFGNRTFAQGAQVTIVRTDAARWFIWGTGIT